MAELLFERNHFPANTMRIRIVKVVAIALLFTGCASRPQRANIPTYWLPSKNFDQRRPNFVIIHYTGSATFEEAIRTLTDPAQEVSAHYLVRRDGIIYQLVDERGRAWHAGESRWGSDTDLNSSSLGIELDNNGREPFSDAQITALLALLDDIKRRYHIPTSNFLGHSDIAPERKIDPGRYFPWKMLSEHGFGLWCDSPAVELPTSFDAAEALQALGYDISNIEAAIRAFKLHFASDDSSPELNDDERKLLYCLLQNKENLQKAK